MNTVSHSDMVISEKLIESAARTLGKRGVIFFFLIDRQIR